MINKKISLIILLVIICSLTGCAAPFNALQEHFDDMLSSANKEHNKNISSESSNITKEYNLFLYEEINNSIAITKYIGNKKENVVIPDIIDGKPVTLIGQDSFYQHSEIVNVTLPQYLTTLDGSPFYRCYSLSKLYIPKYVKLIDGNPVWRCPSLENISVDPDNKYYTSIDGVLFDKDVTTMIAYPEGNEREIYEIPHSVTKIDESTFGYKCNYLKKLIIHPNLTDFSNYNLFVYPEDITLIVKSGSPAEQYAKKHGLKYELMENTNQ